LWVEGESKIVLDNLLLHWVSICLVSFSPQKIFASSSNVTFEIHRYSDTKMFKFFGFEAYYLKLTAFFVVLFFKIVRG